MKFCLILYSRQVTIISNHNIYQNLFLLDNMIMLLSIFATTQEHNLTTNQEHNLSTAAFLFYAALVITPFTSLNFVLDSMLGWTSSFIPSPGKYEKTNQRTCLLNSDSIKKEYKQVTLTRNTFTNFFIFNECSYTRNHEKGHHNEPKCTP